MNTVSNMEGLHCMPWLNEMIRKFILLAKEIPCFDRPSLYFRKLYAKYLYERDKTDNYAQGFLDTAECRVINAVYHKICEHWVERGVLESAKPLRTAQDIQEDDVVSIRCHTIFTGYHFIFAVVGKKTVDIYQSYGYSRPLYRISGISVAEFKRLIENMEKIDEQEYGLEKMREIEENIYGTDYESRMKMELREINRSGDSDGMDISREELETELFQKNVVQTAADFQMAVYKFKRPECKRASSSAPKSRKRKRESRGTRSSTASRTRGTKRRRKSNTNLNTNSNTK